MERKVVLGLLDKVGASYTKKIALDRASKKLVRYIEKDGVPSELTEEETTALIELGVDVNPKTPKKKPEPKAKTAPKPKAEKNGRADWMACAAKALKEHGNISKAEEAALAMYLSDGGRETPKGLTNAHLNVSRAVRALVAFGAVSLSEDGESVVVG